MHTKKQASTCSYEIVDDPLLKKVVILNCYDQINKKNLIVKIAPEFGSTIFSFSVNNNELFWFDREYFAENKNLGAFTGNFVVAPIGVNREINQKGVFKGQKLDFHAVPKPSGDEPLVHGIARLLPWEIGKIIVTADSVSVETTVTYGKQSDGTFVPYCQQAYPYDVTQTHRHLLTREGLTVFSSFSNLGNMVAPVAHTLHADFSTALSGAKFTDISIPAAKHITTKDSLPIYPIELKSVEHTHLDLHAPTRVSTLQVDDYYTQLDPYTPAIFNPLTKDFLVEITASPEYKYFVVFTKYSDTFVALEWQTNIPTALHAFNHGYKKLANIIELQPKKTHEIWTKYAITAKSPEIHQHAYKKIAKKILSKFFEYLNR